MAGLRDGLRLTGYLLAAAGVVLVVLLWPQSLGGAVAYVRVDGHSMDPTLHTGDLAVVRRQASYRIGDPVAYRIPRGEFAAGALVIHRLVGGNGTTGFVTRGDNRTRDDEWHPRTADVVGRVRFVVPGAGTRLAALSRPVDLGALVAAVTFVVLLLPTRSPGRPRHARPSTPPQAPAPAGPSRRTP